MATKEEMIHVTPRANTQVITSSSNRIVNQVGRASMLLFREGGVAEVTDGFLSLMRPFYNLLAVVGQLGCGQSTSQLLLCTLVVLHAINNKGHTEAKTMSKWGQCGSEAESLKKKQTFGRPEDKKSTLVICFFRTEADWGWIVAWHWENKKRKHCSTEIRLLYKGEEKIRQDALSHPEKGFRQIYLHHSCLFMWLLCRAG